jgi:hypothetical protein
LGENEYLPYQIDQKSLEKDDPGFAGGIRDSEQVINHT